MLQKLGKRMLAGTRVIVATLVSAAVVVLCLGLGASWDVALSGGWSAGALVILVWTWWSIGPKDAAATAAHSQREDFSRPLADAVVLVASVASLVAVAFTLVSAGNHHDGAKAFLIALALVSVALAWGTVHTVYALRYADLYYRPPVGGVDFNDDDPPDYRDFAYLALTVGMTYQVSDTDLQTKQIRRTAIRHAGLSFVFGSVILAVTINTVASLLK